MRFIVSISCSAFICLLFSVLPVLLPINDADIISKVFGRCKSRLGVLRDPQTKDVSTRVTTTKCGFSCPLPPVDSKQIVFGFEQSKRSVTHCCSCHVASAGLCGQKNRGVSRRYLRISARRVWYASTWAGEQGGHAKWKETKRLRPK